ncbi:hypothetical protein EVAR_64894_1 [Eumeta japonica]|uniref:Uncharacterized protein n=1 Tax=Eumeta variegata TaxID=151549 RepID=A0A4C1ZX39_EUMVA|nr:hypothetical protein EVAR_64894_1 [Eumeta japonica]
MLHSLSFRNVNANATRRVVLSRLAPRPVLRRRRPLRAAGGSTNGLRPVVGAHDDLLLDVCRVTKVMQEPSGARRATCASLIMIMNAKQPLGAARLTV